MFFPPSRSRECCVAGITNCLPHPCAAILEHATSVPRAGATPRTFWAAESRKSGVAPARFDVFFTVTFAFPGFVLLRFPRTSGLLQVKKCQFQKCRT